MPRLKTAIIGLGRQAANDHIPGLRDSQHAQLEAICDIDEAKTKEFESKLGVKGYTDYHTLLESAKDLDFVIVCTPHDTHGAIVEAAAKSHVHILKEKPFARNLAEAHHIKRICEENGIQLMTTVQRRFNPIYTTFFHLKDRIGNPFLIDAQYTLFVSNPEEGWRGNKEQAGGGCIIDMGYHMVDTLVWYFGLPDKVHAEFSAQAKPEKRYDAEDTANILFAFDNGLHGSLRLSRYSPHKTEYIRVVGDHGIVEVERGGIKRLKSNGEVTENLVRTEAWPIAAADQIDHFCDVIRGKKPNMGAPEEHLQRVSFIDACYKSKAEGKYISPKELLKHG